MIKKIIVSVSIILIGMTIVSFYEVQNTLIKKHRFFPQSLFIIEREGYTLAFDGRTRNAYWVYEELSQKSLEKKNADRRKINFKADESIPLPIRSTLEDYRKSGFDQGHLCPYADCESSQEGAAETFLLSNVSPQVHGLNFGHWLKLERYLRKLTLQYQLLHIITIPLYLPENNYVRYQVIGKNQIAVPTHFCKVVFAEKKMGFDVLAYIMPNREIANDEPLDRFQTTLEQVERLSGVIFLPPPQRIE